MRGPRECSKTWAGSLSGTAITAACLEFAKPRRAPATVARAIQPAPPALLFQIPAKGLRCCGPSVPGDGGLPSRGNADFQQLLPSQSARQRLKSPHHLRTPRRGCQWRVAQTFQRLRLRRRMRPAAVIVRESRCARILQPRSHRCRKNNGACAPALCKSGRRCASCFGCIRPETGL